MKYVIKKHAVSMICENKNDKEYIARNPYDFYSRYLSAQHIAKYLTGSCDKVSEMKCFFLKDNRIYDIYLDVEARIYIAIYSMDTQNNRGDGYYYFEPLPYFVNHDCVLKKYVDTLKEYLVEKGAVEI